MNIIKHNLGLKILALVLSIVAWMAVHVFINPEHEDTVAHSVYTLPIKFIDPGSDMVYSADVKEAVVTLRGSLSQLNRITPELISAEVNLSGRTQAGNGLEAVNVMAPGGAVVANVDPAYIWVKVSKRLAKHVPVRVSLQGQVERGFSTGRPEVVPEKVVVSGADNKVNSVVALRAPLAVSHANSTFSAEVRTLLPVNADGDAVSGVEIGEGAVNVTVPVYALVRVPVSMDNVKIVAAGGKDSYTVTVEPNTVLCECLNKNNVPAAVMTKAQTIKLGSEEIVLTLPLEMSDGVVLASGISSNAVVKITPKKKAAKTEIKKKKKLKPI